MARTIDERIVQMTFNNQEFERRANTTISTLGKLGKSVMNLASMAKSLTGLQRATDGLDFSNITDSLTGINKGFSVFEEIATGVCRRIGDAIGSYILGGLNKVKSTLDSVTVAQIGQGFQKYVDLTGSVQTLANSTGKGIDEIDAYLERLMWYSDETSFGFTDMTKALGTMVSSGGEIDKLIPMLMGVGNAVAYAGKGASEFQRVIYNLNQSYSGGFLSTLDWKSISGASVDTKELKMQLLGAAVELGNITESQAKLENFSKLMSDKVFDRNVMELAFGRFAEFTLKVEEAVKNGEFETASEAMEALSGSTAKFAEDAFIAGQSAKSFKEAIEATQDAVSSGWMKTFKLIFGNYEESKALWSDVTETFWDLFASGAEKRNDILQEWKSIWQDTDKAIQYFGKPFEKGGNLTQTQAVINTFSEAVLTLRDALISIANETFDFPTIEQAALSLFNAVEKVRSAIQRFIDDLSAPPIERSGLLRMFESLYDTAMVTIKLFGTVGREINSGFIQPVAKMLKPILEDVFGIIKDVSDVLSHNEWGIIKDLSPVQKILKGIVDILSPMISLIGSAIHWVRELVDAWRLNQLKLGTDHVNVFAKALEVFGGIIKGVADVVRGGVNVFQKLSDVISDLLPKIKDSITNFLQTNGTDVSKFAEGGILGILGIGLATLIKKFKDFSIKDLTKNFGSGLVDNIKDVFDALTEGINGLLGRGGNNTPMLKSMADAITELAVALLILSLVDGEKIGDSLMALGGALGEAIAALYLMNGIKINKGAKKALSGLATAILEISIALAILGTMEPQKMSQAVLALGGVLLELAGFMTIIGLVSKKMSGGNVKAIAKVISKLGFALIEIAAALKILSSIDGKAMQTSLEGMLFALTEIGTFIVLVSNFLGEKTTAKLAMLGPTMIGLGLALIEIAAALKLLSTIEGSKMQTSLEGMLFALTEIGTFIVLASKFTKGGGLGFIAIATGMLIMAAAINALTIPLIALSAIGWDGMKEGLLTLGAMMGILAVSGAVLGVISPLMLAAAIAMTAFGASLYVVSAAMLKAVSAFLAFQVIGSDFALTIVDVLTDAFAAVVAVLPSFILGIVEAVIGMAGKLIELVETLINIVLTAINEQLPSIIQNVITFVASVLEGLGNAIDILGPLLFEVAFGLLDALITGLRENIPTLLENLFGLLIDVINGLADLIRSGGGELGAALGNLASALIEGIFGAVGGLVSGIGEGIIGVGEGLWEGAKGLWTNLFGGKDQVQSQEDSGANIIENVTTGMDEHKEVAYDKADEIGNETAKELEDAEEAKSSGKDTLDGLIAGLSDPEKLDAIFLAGTIAGKKFMEGYNTEMDQHSPSRKMEEEAEFTIAGLVKGFRNLGDISQSGMKVGEAIYNSVANALSLASEMMDDAMNPVITPVIDLSEIEASSGKIQGLFGNNLAYDGALSINALRTASGIQNGTNFNNPINVNIDFTVNNAGRDLTDADVLRFSKQISNEVNIRLGKLLKI